MNKPLKQYDEQLGSQLYHLIRLSFNDVEVFDDKIGLLGFEFYPQIRDQLRNALWRSLHDD